MGGRRGRPRRVVLTCPSCNLQLRLSLMFGISKVLEMCKYMKRFSLKYLIDFFFSLSSCFLYVCTNFQVLRN